PLSGAALITVTGWRGIFAAMAVAALVAMLVTAVWQAETLPKEQRVPVHLKTMGRGIRTLMRDPVFMGLTFVGGFGMAAFFIFIASAAFVYVETFGLTPTQFSLAFTVNAMGFIGASQAAAPLMQKHGALTIILLGVGGFAASMCVLMALALMGLASFLVILAGLIAGFGFMGLVIPTTMVAALDPHGEIAGLASSLGGTLQMVAGGVMVAASGPFFDGTPTPMIGAMTVCSLITLGLLLAILPRARRIMSAG
uniref:MFS transporter n=1 Tax=Celeribacter marinus TaxID=1397108 RepID=UPI003F6BF0B7